MHQFCAEGWQYFPFCATALDAVLQVSLQPLYPTRTVSCKCKACLQDNTEAKLMGDQLRNLGEAQFSRATAVGAKPSFGDWKVAPELLSGSLAAAAAELAMELPTSQSTPPMYTKADQTGAVVPLNGNSLEASSSFVFCL